MWTTIVIKVIELVIDLIRDSMVGKESEKQEKLRRIKYAKDAHKRRDKSGILDALNGRMPNDETKTSTGDGV